MEIEVNTGLSILGAAFTAWAWVVWWGVRVVRKEIEGVRQEVSTLATSATETANALTNHILMTEKRLTMLETEFAFMRRYMTKLEEK